MPGTIIPSVVIAVYLRPKHLASLFWGDPRGNRPPNRRQVEQLSLVESIPAGSSLVSEIHQYLLTHCLLSCGLLTSLHSFESEIPSGQLGLGPFVLLLRPDASAVVAKPNLVDC